MQDLWPIVMAQPSLLYHLDLATIGALAAILLFLCSTLGHQLGARVRRRRADQGETAASDLVASTILGLLALILSFTFSMAITRFEKRRQLVIEEANAIGTAHLRARLLREAEGDRFKDLLKTYLIARIEYYDASWKSERGKAAQYRVKSLQGEIWSNATRVMRADRGVIESIFISSLNSMIDLENERTIALEKTLPEVIYGLILVIAASGLSVFSFGRGARGEPGGVLSLLLAGMISCVFVLIQDIERPRDGAIRITQDAMISLHESLKNQ